MNFGALQLHFRSHERYLFWELRSPGILRSVEWQFRTDVSGQPVGPIFKGQAVKEECYFIPCLE
jgi:hypothetical protein